MSDKQREKHLAAYWNGPITRAEAQKVFDEQAVVIMKQAEMITKLDAVASFLSEKAGYSVADIQAWITEKMKGAAEAAEGAAEAAEGAAQEEQPEQGQVVLA
jgi:hypothetical protein